MSTPMMCGRYFSKVLTAGTISVKTKAFILLCTLLFAAVELFPILFLLCCLDWDLL